MLQQLVIKDVAIIKELTIMFDKGLNVLTGETGAGKSIIIDSINIVLGERISKDIIRTGANKAVVQAVFQVKSDNTNQLLNQIGIPTENDDCLIICREITSSGKNTCWINNRIVTTSTLREIGNLIVDIHGQHDNQSLFNVSNHIKLLDLFGGTEIFQLKSQYAQKFNEYINIKADINEISTRSNTTEKQKDFIEYQCNEIESAHLSIGEEEALITHKNILINSQKILSILEESYNVLYSGGTGDISVIDNLFTINKHIEQAMNIEQKLIPVYTAIEDIAYQLQDISSEIRDIKNSVEYNPSCLDQIDERLDIISKLKRKYGGSVEEVIKNLENLKNELEILANRNKKLHQLKEKQSQLCIELLNLSEQLSIMRHNAAEILEKNICEILEQMEMKKNKFKVDIKYNNNINDNGNYLFSEDGLDTVEFLISTTPGEPLKPLNKIASGGEISRIMLAIKTILASVDNIPTLIFDEIDTGISGKAAQQVSEKMATLSILHQIICVTHLPFIACIADSHYKIIKNIEGITTNITVEKLEQDAVQYEIARIMNGANITELTLKHAEEMISLAKHKKSLIQSTC